MRTMFKTVAGIAIAALLIIGVAFTAFARSSRQDGVDISGNYDSIEYGSTEEAVKNANGWTALTPEKAAALINAAGGNVKASELKILWQNVVNGQNSPLDLTFTATTSPNQVLYAFYYFPIGGSSEDFWVLAMPYTGAAGSTLTASFPGLPAAVALVVFTPSGVDGDTSALSDDDAASKSPKTGENDILLFIALAAIVLGGVTAVIAAKNKA